MASSGDGRRTSKSLLLAPLGLGIEGGRQDKVRMGLPRRVHAMATDIRGTQSSRRGRNGTARRARLVGPVLAIRQ